MYDSLRSRAEERVNAKIRFYGNLVAYVIVNAILFVVNWLYTPNFWWVAFPLFFWGLGVFKDFLRAFVFADYFTEDYRERKIQEEMEKIGNQS